MAHEENPDSRSGVRNNHELGRFEIETEGGIAFLDYSIGGGKIVMPHTVVPAEHRGRGYGEMLARAALTFAREEELEVVPTCPFVAAFIAREPEVGGGQAP
jgi:predicted GNAT family acetyltransferase